MLKMTQEVSKWYILTWKFRFTCSWRSLFINRPLPHVFFDSSKNREVTQSWDVDIFWKWKHCISIVHYHNKIHLFLSLWKKIKMDPMSSSNTHVPRLPSLAAQELGWAQLCPPFSSLTTLQSWCCHLTLVSSGKNSPASSFRLITEFNFLWL